MNLRPSTLWRVIALTAAVTAFLTVTPGQRAALVVPDGDPTALGYAKRLNDALARDGVKLADLDAAGSAFRSQDVESPFNMTLEEAVRVGAAIGTDAYILIRGTTQRRSSFEFPEYYESSAAVFLVSSRSGRLGFWRLQLSQGPDPETAAAGLNKGPEELAPLLVAEIEKLVRTDVGAARKERAPELPADGSRQTDGFRPPMPYRRLKPEYTPEAFLFDVRATVDIEAEIDEEGRIIDTEIVRWAGYGLDGSVTKTVREMNWRPAERQGKTLPMRVLLRYNFKKAEPDETDN
jgi:hypothetical protein